MHLHEMVYGVKQYRVTDIDNVILFSSNIESNCQTFMDKYADLCFECHLWLDKYNPDTQNYENISELTKVTFGMSSDKTVSEAPEWKQEPKFKDMSYNKL